jgi:hypothetical protein
MVKNASQARKRRATTDRKRAAKGQVPREIEIEIPLKRRGQVALPLVRSKQSGTIALDNAKIFEFIPFP